MSSSPMASLYVEDAGMYFLRSLPDAYRPKLKDLASGRDEAVIRLRLTSGQQFILPIAVATRKSVESALKSLSPVVDVDRLRAAFGVVRPLLRRLRLLNVVRGWARRNRIAERVYEDSRVLYFEDDHLYTSVGNDLLVHDPHVAAPKSIGLCLTNRCNLECGMCPYHSPIEKQNHATDYFKQGQLIAPDQLKRVLDYAEKHKSVVGLGQMDEPLIAMFAPKYWPLFRDTNAPMSITTNGTLLKEEKDFARIASIKKLGSISVSLDAASEESYRKIRGGELNEIRPAIIAFFDYLRRNRPDVERRVCFVAQPDNRGEEQAFLEQWKEHVNVVSIYQMTQYETESGALEFDHNFTEGPRTPCASIFETMYVMPQGEVLPCCLFMYVSPYQGMKPIGGFDEKFWDSERYHKFRSSVTEEKFHPICSSCTVWKQGHARWVEENGMRVSLNPFEKHYHVG
jgi:radical SAM protein with 4Fe4S-binding SPASM domain